MLSLGNIFQYVVYKIPVSLACAYLLFQLDYAVSTLSAYIW
jgi:hypothetical protein